MSYRAKRAAEGAQSEPHGLTCSECHSPAPWGVLAMYGARCSPCFRRYANFGKPETKGNEPPLTLDEKREFLRHLRTLLSEVKADKEWAHRLREREARQEPLSPAQRDAWRRALRHQLEAQA